VDARGVQVAAPFQANRASFGKRNKPARGSSPVDSGYETMESLAEETGGRSFHHINDLNSAILAAAADSRVTYSLAFYPPEPALDDSYHRLEVSVDRPGVTLRYTSIPWMAATKCR
jgi:VWFA-related protein